MEQQLHKNYFAHPTAVIDEGAVIGEGTKIWHFSHIMPGAKIGSNCILGQNTFVADGVVIGNLVKIQNNVSLYTGVIVEDEVFLGPSVVLTNVVNPRSFIERKDEYKPTLIRRGASIGANATVLSGIQLGAWCFIGAGAVVTRNVPDFALFTGNPARHRGWMSKAGHKLEFDDDGKAFCAHSNEHYQLNKENVVIAI
jgi:UDP-2-acetamido-3-amino-2,3-dideoxy-glucuronate N-acetyltransferase